MYINIKIKYVKVQKTKKAWLKNYDRNKHYQIILNIYKYINIKITY